MKRSAYVALVFASMSGAAYAHHSRAMFDVTRNITFSGVVRAYNWQNPHTTIVVLGNNAKDSSTAVTWNIEASSVSIMRARGWSKNTLEMGDKITVVAHPNRDGSKDVLLFYVIMPDGKRLYRAAHRYSGEVDE